MVKKESWRLEKNQFINWCKSALELYKDKNPEELAKTLWRRYNDRIRCSYGNGYRAGYIAGVKEGARK